MKKLIISLNFLFISIFSFMFFVPKVSALSFDSTYSDTVSTSSQSINLINYAMSYDDFLDSDYVIFNDSQNSYYIVWSKNMKVSNGIVTATNVQYVHYYRSSNYNSYSYVYGTDSNFTLHSSFINTSSLPNYGFKSSIYDEYKSSYYNKHFFILILAFIFVIMLNCLRRSYQ